MSSPRIPSRSWVGMSTCWLGAPQFRDAADIELCVAGRTTSSNGRSHSDAAPLHFSAAAPAEDVKARAASAAAIAATVFTFATLLGAFEHHDRDLAVGLLLVLVVVLPLADHDLPELGLLVGSGVAGADLEALGFDLDLGGRVGLQVEVPGRRLGGPALRRDDQEVVAAAAEDQRRRALLAALAPLGGEQQDLRPLPPLVAFLAIGRAVPLHMLLAEQRHEPSSNYW